jgi:hypothetical protein
MEKGGYPAVVVSTARMLREAVALCSLSPFNLQELVLTESTYTAFLDSRRQLA